MTDGTTWTQQAYIKASNTARDDRFGGSVALSGGTLAVAARYEGGWATGVDGDETDISAFDWNGAVYLYAQSGTTWVKQHYVKASNTGSDDEFGCSIALSGGTLVVGALNEDSAAGIGGDEADDSAERSGAVYVFLGPVGS